MDTWQRFGASIGSRMPFIVPFCVAAGVLFPEAISPLAPAVPALFAFMTFQGSLSNTTRQVIDIFRHPAPLAMTLFLVMVLMPCLSYAIARLFFAHNANLVTGTVLAYSVPVGIVSFMWVGIHGGNPSLGLAAILISTVLSPFSIPATLWALLGESIQMDALGMMRDMIFMIALPAIAGTALNDLTHGWARQKLSPVLSPASKMLLIAIITINSTKVSEYVLNPTWERAGVAAMILTFTCTGFALGAVAGTLMRQKRETTITMSIDCGLRNISAGAVIAAQYFPGEVVFPVMCGTIFQQLIASIAGKMLRRIGMTGQTGAKKD